MIAHAVIVGFERATTESRQRQYVKPLEGDFKYLVSFSVCLADGQFGGLAVESDLVGADSVTIKSTLSPVMKAWIEEYFSVTVDALILL